MFWPLLVRFWKELAMFTGMILFAITLGGCAAETANPLGTEKLGGTPPEQESFAEFPVDCRGYFNGVFEPAGTSPALPGLYPVSYVGSWTLIPAAQNQNLYMAECDKAGSTCTIVGTFSRVIFEFWNYKLYPNPGTVNFQIDGKSIGSFALARDDSRGDQILDYVLTNSSQKLATYTMTLQSGRCVVSGFTFVYP